MISSLTIIAATVLLLGGYENNQTSMGLENMAKTLRGDVRLVAMGDSFSSRVFFSCSPSGASVLADSKYFSTWLRSNNEFSASLPSHHYAVPFQQ